MDKFTADLDSLTAGMSVTRYANDDEEFNYVVSQMEDMGHDREAAAAALAEWITNTPTWDCPNCNLENIEEAGFASCPNCGADNPSVVVGTITRQGSGRHHAGRVYELRIGGVYVGTYETKRQAQDALLAHTSEGGN